MKLLKHILHIMAISFFLLSCIEEEHTPLRLGTNIWPGYEPIYLARDLNFIQSSKVKLIEYHSASEVIRSFRNGNIDAAALTLDEALLLLEKGIEIKIILVCDFSNGGDVIMSNPSLKHISEFAGKTVGVESNALGAFILMRAFDIYGLPLESITLKHFEVNQHEMALNKGIIDAVVTFEPIRSRLLKAGAIEIFTSREMPGEIVDVIVVRSEFLATHKTQISHLTKGWFQALHYIGQQPDEAAKFMDKRLKIGSHHVAESLKLLSYPSREENINLLVSGRPQLRQTILRLNNFMVSKKLLKQDVPVDSLFAETLPSLIKK